MSLLARRLGYRLLAQTISGFSFGLSGYLVARAGFLSVNAALAWLPWILLGAHRIAEPVGNTGPPGWRAWAPIRNLGAVVMPLAAGVATTT